MNTSTLRAFDGHEGHDDAVENPHGTGRRTASALQFEALDDLDAPKDGASVASLHPLRNVKARVDVIVGSVEVSVGELLDAKESHVLTLDRALTHPVDLVVEGQVIARGQLVAVDDRFAVRITELPAPLAL
ncbi:FliM/FliN family flagellar motor switch protein [Pandoraea pneumonica]|uniref:FliM/FliN family flagellar motor switch protein n=1 Tax=Pandoraea pneumonica TaxID=2508299 RepID=UPI003CF4315D